MTMEQCIKKYSLGLMALSENLIEPRLGIRRVFVVIRPPRAEDNSNTHHGRTRCKELLSRQISVANG